MSNPTSVLVVIAQDTDGNFLEDSTIELFAQSDVNLASPLSIDVVSSGNEKRITIEQGIYIVRVAADGLVAQERLTNLVTSKFKREYFLLGAPGMPSYYSDNKQIPFTPINDKIVILLSTPTPPEALSEFFDENDISVYKNYNNNYITIQLPVADESTVETIKTGLLLNENIRSAGIPVRLQEKRFSYLTGRILIEFNPVLTENAIRELLDSFEFNLLPGKDIFNKYTAQYRAFPDLNFLSAAEQLKNNDDVIFISTLTVSSLSVKSPNDYLFANLWHFPYIRVEEAWAKLASNGKEKYGDPSIVIAVYDEAVELTSVDGNRIAASGELIDKVLGYDKIHHSYKFRGSGSATFDIDYNPSGDQSIGHGMMVATIALGNVQSLTSTSPSPGTVGVAPNARLMAHFQDNTNASTSGDYFIWASGMFAPFLDLSNAPPALFPANPGGLTGPHIINNSWADGDNFDGTLEGTLDSYQTEGFHMAAMVGRNGRGIYNVFVSGNSHYFGSDLAGGDNVNQNNPLDINVDTPQAKHPKTIVVGASSIDNSGVTEIHASYSYFGAKFLDYYGVIYDATNSIYERDPNPTDVKLLDFVAPSHDRYTDLTYAFPSSRIDNHPYNYAITAGHLLHGSLMEDLGDSANMVGSLASLTTTIKESMPVSSGIISVEDTSGLYPGQYLILGNFPSSYEINRVDTINTSNPWQIQDVILTCNHIKLDHDAASSYGTGTLVNGLTRILPEDHGSYVDILVTNVFVSTNEIEVTDRTGFVADQLLFIGDPSSGSGTRQRWKVVGNGTSSTNSLEVTLEGSDTFTLSTSLVNLPVYIFGGDIQTVLTSNLSNVTSPPTPAQNQTVNVKSTARLRVGYALFIGAPGLGTSENCVITSITNPTSVVVNRLFKNHSALAIIYGGRASYINTMGGTSASAPQASGIAALVLTANLNLTWVEIRDMMRKTAMPIGLAASTNPATGAWVKPDGTLITNTYANPTSTITLAAPANPGDQSITVSSAAELKLRMRIKLEDGATNEVRIVRRIVGNVITVDPMVNTFASGTTTIKIGDVVHYSNYMGFGRLDAELAVTEALDYSHDDRDLMLRDTILDTGISAPASNIKIDSPDIWVRYTAHTAAELNTIAGQTSEGPHRQPIKGQSRKVYVRVKNRGNKYANLDAWVKCFVCIAPAGTGLEFPEHFIDSTKNYLPQGNDVKIAQLLTINGRAEYFFQEGIIGPGLSGIAEFEWPSTLFDEDIKREITLLAIVTPLDGPFFGAGNTVKTITDSNNLTSKKVAFVNKVSINNDLTPPGALTKKIGIPSDDIATPVTTGFKIFVRNSTAFDPQGVSIKAKFVKLDTTTEEVTFKFSSGAWGFVTAPTGGWFQCDAPLKDPFGPTDLVNASTSETEILFNCNFTVTYEYSTVTITVETPVDSSVLYPIDVKVVYPENSDVDAEKSKLHFFTDLDLLDTVQPQANAYGPVPSFETTKFQVTSRHTATTGGVDPKVYAICDGKILVQRNEDHPLTHVNLILKPENQGAVDFLNVQYFIYRGIKKDSLVDPDDIKMAPELTNDLTSAVWADQNSVNRHRETANGVAVNSIQDKPTKKALGLHFVDTPAGVDEVQKLDTDLIDQVFFNPEPDFRAIPISKGMYLGKFDMAGFGFDVITDGLGFVPTFEMVRRDTHVIVANAPASTSATTLQKLVSASERAHVLNFIDPCAFYGLHFNNRVFVHDSANTVDKITGNEIYDQVLIKFFNKDAVYLDIRNENGYPFNYYGNYGTQDIQLALQDDIGVTLSPPPTTNSWPIYILRDTDFTGTSPNTSEKNIIRLSLPQGDNDKPLLYMAFGQLFDNYPVKPKGKNKFLVPEFSTAYSDEIRIGVPNRSGLSVTAASSWYVKLYYIRRAGATTPSNEPKVEAKTFFDLMFPVVDVSTWNTPDNVNIISGVNERFIEQDDFACMAETGIASEPGRYIFFAVPTDVYFAGGNVTTFYKGISGGTSNKPSIFETVKGNFPKMTLKKRQLQTSPVIEYLKFESDNGINDPLVKNFIGIGISSIEFTDILNDITATQLDATLHYPALVVKQVNTLGDANSNGYYKYELAVAGIKIDGTYAISTDTYEGHGVDNLMITTDGFAAAETASGTTTKCIEFDTTGKDVFEKYTHFGRIIKRVKPFINASGVLINKWKLLNSSGVIQTYGPGEITNFGSPITTGTDIEIPVGTRLVMLDCKTLAVPAQGSINYIRVVCFYNRNYREGYISEHAINDNNNRVIGSELLSDDEIVDAFVNDAFHEIQLSTNIKNEINSTDPNIVLFNNVLDETTNLLGDVGTFNTLIANYSSGTVFQKSTIATRIRNLSIDTGLNFETYFDQKAHGLLINGVATVQKYDTIIQDELLVLSLSNNNYLLLPLMLAWTGYPDPYFQAKGYDETLAAFCAENCQDIIGQLNGGSGSSMGGSSATAMKEQLKDLRDHIAGRNVDDPIRQTPEAQWLLDPILTDTYIDAFDEIVMIHSDSWISQRTNFLIQGIPVDQSFGTLDSNNVFSVLIHEYNVMAAGAVVKFPDDTHIDTSGVPLAGSFENKSVTHTAWEYVRDNDFALFSIHGFVPNALYVDGNGNVLGNLGNTRAEAIGFFFERGPSLGIVYLNYYLNKIME